MRPLLGNLLFFCLVCFPHVLHTASSPETDRARCSAAPPAPACWRSEVLGASNLTKVVVHSPTKNGWRRAHRLRAQGTLPRRCLTQCAGASGAAAPARRIGVPCAAQL